MHYQVVFDIASAGYKSWPFSTFGIVFILIGAVLVAARKHLPSPWSTRPAARNLFTFGFLAFAVLWTLATFVGTYRQYSIASDAERTGRALVAEGRVAEFKPMPFTGHSMESFCVAATCFRYSDYVITAGFNNTSSHGGPIREGLPVRLTYVGNTILKLEVAE
jgi:hypothetical protein